MACFSTTSQNTIDDADSAKLLSRKVRCTHFRWLLSNKHDKSTEKKITSKNMCNNKFFIRGNLSYREKWMIRQSTFPIKNSMIKEAVLWFKIKESNKILELHWIKCVYVFRWWIKMASFLVERVEGHGFTIWSDSRLSSLGNLLLDCNHFPIAVPR